jgi:hypothetical protein
MGDAPMGKTPHGYLLSEETRQQLSTDNSGPREMSATDRDERQPTGPREVAPLSESHPSATPRGAEEPLPAIVLLGPRAPVSA